MTNSPVLRLPHLHPEQLTPEQRQLHGEVLRGPRTQRPQFVQVSDASSVLTGPFSAMLASPRVGVALQQLGAPEARPGTAVCRTRSSPPCGTGRRPRLADPGQRAAHDLATAMLCCEDVPDDRYRVAVETLGTAGIFEVSAIVGYYWVLAAQLRLFKVGRPQVGEL